MVFSYHLGLNHDTTTKSGREGKGGGRKGEEKKARKGKAKRKARQGKIKSSKFKVFISQ